MAAAFDVAALAWCMVGRSKSGAQVTLAQPVSSVSLKPQTQTRRRLTSVVDDKAEVVQQQQQQKRGHWEQAAVELRHPDTCSDPQRHRGCCSRTPFQLVWRSCPTPLTSATASACPVRCAVAEPPLQQQPPPHTERVGKPAQQVNSRGAGGWQASFWQNGSSRRRVACGWLVGPQNSRTVEELFQVHASCPVPPALAQLLRMN